MKNESDKKTTEQKNQNKRTGLILLSVVLVFFLGIVIRKVMEPEILNLMN